MAASRPLLALACLAFVSIGLPDGLLGVAWPSMRRSFGRELDALGAILFCTTAGYVTSSVASGALVARLAVGGVLALSCLVTAASLFGYAMATGWTMVLGVAVLTGLGAGAIDAALNTYVAVHHGARTLNWFHACYGVGAATGPVIMTSVLAGGRPWQRGYVIVGAGQVLLAIAFGVSARRWGGPPKPVVAAAPARPAARLRDTAGEPVAQLASATFLVYTGLEAAIGAWAFSWLSMGRGVSTVMAGTAVSVFWGGLTTGRLLAAIGGGRSTPELLLRACVTGVAGCTVLLLMADGWVAVGGLGLAGVALGPVYPLLVATTPDRLGPAHVSNAVGLQVGAAAAGQFLLPGLVGLIAQRAGVSAMPPIYVVFAAMLVLLERWLARAATRPRSTP
jgi:fucose permease